MNPRRSIFGPLSIGLAYSGLGAEAAAFSSFGEAAPNPPTTGAILLSVLGVFVLGIVFGIAGSVRGERLRQLPSLGMGLNILFIALHFLI
jgi:hypothetical protein